MNTRRRVLFGGLLAHFALWLDERSGHRLTDFCTWAAGREFDRLERIEATVCATEGHSYTCERCAKVPDCAKCRKESGLPG